MDGMLILLENKQFDLENFKTQFLLNKQVISSYQDIINKCEKEGNVIITIKSRDLLMTYLFAFFEFADIMKDISKEIIYSIRDIDKYKEPTSSLYKIKFIDLSKKICKYEIAYIEWKKEDVKLLLQEMTQLYWEFELIFKLNEQNFTQIEKDSFIRKKDRKQRTLLKRMMEIDELDYFYSYVPVVLDQDIVKSVHMTLKKAFWDDIKENFPNIDKLLKVFDEMKKNINFLVPKTPEILINLDEVFDIEYIKQLHDLNSTDEQYWFRKCEYLKNLLNEIDSEALEDIHNKYWSSFANNINDNNVEIKDKYNLCIDFFEYFMERTNELIEIKQKYIEHLENIQ
jgi:hypothetical protein